MNSCCDPANAPTASVQLATLFTTGLLMSAGHCIGMCGPLVAMYQGALTRSAPGTARMARSLLIYNAGRILSYMAIGLAVGYAGSLPLRLGLGNRPQAALSFVTGVVVLAAGLSLAGVAPSWLRLEAAPFARAFARSLIAYATRSRMRSFVAGAANGFLPCGPVWAAAFMAASLGNAVRSAAGMFAYGLGTLPLLVALGLGASMAGRIRRRPILVVGAVLIMTAGLQLLARGGAALSLIPHARAGEVVFW